MSVELKVKVKSLAEEARIIRREELKAKKSRRWHAERQQVEEHLRHCKTCQEELQSYANVVEILPFM